MVSTAPGSTKGSRQRATTDPLILVSRRVRGSPTPVTAPPSDAELRIGHRWVACRHSVVQPEPALARRSRAGTVLRRQCKAASVVNDLLLGPANFASARGLVISDRRACSERHAGSAPQLLPITAYNVCVEQCPSSCKRRVCFTRDTARVSRHHPCACAHDAVTTPSRFVTR